MRAPQLSCFPLILLVLKLYSFVNSSSSFVTFYNNVFLSVKQTENSSTQTDNLETGSASDQSAQEMLQQQRQLDDKMWEERMTTALANLTKRLEEKFEEDKNLALKELSQQVIIPTCSNQFVLHELHFHSHRLC